LFTKLAMQELKIDQVSKAYGRYLALKDVSLEARAGETVAICGENGAGKSTLIGILAGARQPTRGRVIIDGQPVTIQNPSHAFELGIRTVYQELSLLPPLSVTENLQLGALPMKGPRIDWKKAHAEAERHLAAIGMPEVDVRRPVASHSVAVQQMLEIAKALVHEPQLLILDEPTGVLTARESRLLFERIHALNARGTLVIYISHRLDEVFEIADRVVVLKDGVTVDMMTRAEATHDRLVRSMVGRPLGAIYPALAPPQDNVVLSARGLGAGRSFADITFDIRAGEIVGFFGLIGSGRTEVARHIFGAAPGNQGTMVIDSKTYAPRSPQTAIAAGLAFVTEERKRDGLLLDADLLDNGGLASMKQLCFGRFLKRATRRHLVAAKARELDVRPPILEQLLRNMSGGNQQKVILTKWLLVEGLRLLILDEPTRGVDIATKVEIYKLIADLAATGVAILLISSEIPELLGLSHRINVMRAGRIVASFEHSEASEEKVFAAAANVRLEAA
jgi:ABC-type sugar transport system ATPase subunit